MYEKHGGSDTRLYKIWCGMRNRCYLPSHDSYPHYGGKGVTVCEDWRTSFSSFRRWAESNGYRADKSIDRINGNGNYEPENCRWATNKQQARNKAVRSVAEIVVVHDGLSMNLSEWARRTRIGYSTLVKRYKSGVTGADLFAEPGRMMARRRAAIAERGNGKAKLSIAQRAEIKASTEPGSVLAARYKVSAALVSMVRAGKR